MFGRKQFLSLYQTVSNWMQCMMITYIALFFFSVKLNWTITLFCVEEKKKKKFFFEWDKNDEHIIFNNEWQVIKNMW